MNPEEYRKNEIEFIALLKNLHQLGFPLQKFFKAMSFLFEKDYKVIIQLSKDIFNQRYLPTKDEIITVLLAQGYGLRDIERISGVSYTAVRKVAQARNNRILYPRADVQIEIVLDDFLKDYKKVFKIDISNLI